MARQDAPVWFGWLPSFVGQAAVPDRNGRCVGSGECTLAARQSPARQTGHSGQNQATRIALELDLDPMTVIAELRADDEKNEKQREFWRNFLTRAASAVGLLVVLHCGSLSSNAAANMLNANGKSNRAYAIGLVADIIANYAQQATACIGRLSRWLSTRFFRVATAG